MSQVEQSRRCSKPVAHGAGGGGAGAAQRAARAGAGPAAPQPRRPLRAGLRVRDNGGMATGGRGRDPPGNLPEGPPRAVRAAPGVPIALSLAQPHLCLGACNFPFYFLGDLHRSKHVHRWGLLKVLLGVSRSPVFSVEKAAWRGVCMGGMHAGLRARSCACRRRW